MSAPGFTYQEDDLFAELAAETVRLSEPVAGMPADLLEYDRLPNQAEARELGETVFVAWLRAELRGREVEVPKPVTPEPCASVREEDEESKPYDERVEFYPREYPVPAEYLADGRYTEETVWENPDLVREWRDVHVPVTRAKQMCRTMCPVRDACLARSVVTFEEFGVWGGWGAVARTRIYNQFIKLRRAYQSDRMSESARRGYEAAAGATPR